LSRNARELAEVLRQHAGLITRVARAHESDRGRAEELTQEIHLAIWQALPKYRGESNLRTYIARIAHNRAVLHVAREARAPNLVSLDPFDESLPSGAHTPEAAALQAEARRRLERAVQELPIALKLTVTLALEGFSADEVAGVLGISASAAAVRLHRAKAALQDKLREQRA